MPSQNHLSTYVKVLHDIQRELWNAAINGLPPRTLVYAELKRRIDRTRYYEKTNRIQVQTAAKQSKAQAAYRICKWLIENDDNYIAFVNGFVTCKNALCAKGIDPGTVSFSFILEHKLWSHEAFDTNKIRHLDINFYYLTAEQRIFEAIIDTIILTGRTANQKYIATNYVRSPEAQALLAVYTDISPMRCVDVYNLSDMFDSINAQYFGGQIPKPLIAWTSRANYRKVGSYNYALNIILISKLMNDQRVPELAVRFVMYHEMLHIKHGVFEVNGRRMAHTPEFLAEERMFIGYAEAEKMLSQLTKFCQ